MKPLVILAGPTAVGKTALSIKLAKKINGAVISADSMQVYKHMDIGSAKVMPEEMKGIPHYLIDVLEPSEEFNIVRFQQMAKDMAKEEDLVFLCGHYEGIDERVLEEIVTDYVSIGDYVLTGGELPAMVMMDSISRMVPGVLSNQESGETESFAGNLLEYPQYSRPEEWHGKKVPEVLMSGHHANIEKWRREQSIIRTARRRPDLLKKADLTNKEWNFVRQLKKQWKEEESKDENI